MATKATAKKSKAKPAPPKKQERPIQKIKRLAKKATKLLEEVKQELTKPVPTEPAERPANYTRIHMPSGKCPVEFKGDPTDKAAALIWGEQVRDHYEQQREVPSQQGMMILAMSAGGKVLADTVRDLYANEPAPSRPRTVQLQHLRPGDRFHDGVRTGQLVELFAGGDAKVHIVSGLDAGKTMLWSRRAEVYWGQLPHVPAESANGRRQTPTRAENGDTPRKERPQRQPTGPRLQDAPAKLDNQTDVKVEWTGSGGRFKCSILGHPLRGVVRWLGWKGFTVEQVMSLLAKMGLADYPNLKAVVAGHVASGKAGEKGCHGPPAQLTDEQGKQLKKHLK